MANYSLTDAVSGLRGRHPWMTQAVIRQPLNGLVDGVNTLFYLATPPMATSSLTVYSSAGVSLAHTVLSADAGSISMTVAPTAPCTASYTHVLLSDTAMATLCTDGFALMESLLPRSWYLYDDNGSTVVSSSNAAAVDPVITGTVTFSASVVQKRFFLDACQVVLYKYFLTDAANNAISVREERVGGLQIDRQRQYLAWKAALDDAEEALTSSAEAAAEEAGLEDTLLEGSLVPGAQSDYHYKVLDWWRDGLQSRGAIS